jgi:CBS domain-containing protein/GGDEF domain-containing protein/Flp pilus assembly pilin Flp
MNTSAIRRLTQDSQGSSGVSYALMLAAVVGSVIAGATMLGANVERTFAKVAEGTANPVTSDPTESEISDSVARRHSDDSPKTTKASVPRVMIYFLMAAVPIVSVIVGWLVLRRPAKPNVDRPVPRREPVDAKVLLTRLNVKREALWRLLMSDNDLLLKSQIAVRHVMTFNPVTIKKSTSGKQIAELISKHHVARLLVCNDNDVLLGVVCASDHQANPEAAAETIMTSQQSSIAPNSTLGVAVSLLIERGLSFLPVVDQGKLCGVLTPTDLVLTLHCSLHLWIRVAQTRESSFKRAKVLETTSSLMEKTADQLKSRVLRLPEEVKTVIETGNSTGLVNEIDELTSSVTQLMLQLDNARAQIREQTSQIADLKESAPDETTGAASREELDRSIRRLLDGSSRTQEPLSLILSATGNYQKLRRDEGLEAADEHLRLLAECVAENVGPKDQVARYLDDTLAIVLPGSSSVEARLLCSRLATATQSAFGDEPSWRPDMSIVTARSGESATEFMKRAESGLAHNPGELAETVIAEVVG